METKKNIVFKFFFRDESTHQKGDDTSAKLRPPFASPGQWQLFILAFMGQKDLFVLLTLFSSAFWLGFFQDFA